MAPGLIVPGVARYSIIGTYAGVNVANVLDIDLDTPGSTARADAVLDQAKVIVSAWADHICPLLSDEYSALSVKWVDMNSSDGTTGEVTEGTGSSFPQAGARGGNPMPGSVAFLIHKQINASRGSRSGRMFLAGVMESDTGDTTPNTIIPATIATMTTALEDFRNAVNQDGVLGDYSSDISVIHTKNTANPEDDPIIVYVSQSSVDALVPSTKIRTQRRRLGP